MSRREKLTISLSPLRADIGTRIRSCARHCGARADFKRAWHLLRAPSGRSGQEVPMNRSALSYSPRLAIADSGGGKSLRILLAEDDREMRRLLALVLRSEGHEVVEARDGAELLEAVATDIVH